MSTEKYQRFVNKKVNRRKKIDKLIYGLLYPAFFGNMVYDILLFKDNYKELGMLPIDCLTMAAILLFNAVDYYHLYGDINEIVKSNKRSIYYRLCDFTVPILFFGAFVCLREGWVLCSYLLIMSVPIFFTVYKWEYSKSKQKFVNLWKSKNPWNIWPVIILSLLSIVFVIGWAPWRGDEKELIYHQHLSGYVLTIMILYSIYVFIIYPNKAREKDWEHYNKENAESGSALPENQSQ